MKQQTKKAEQQHPRKSGSLCSTYIIYLNWTQIILRSELFIRQVIKKLPPRLIVLRPFYSFVLGFSLYILTLTSDLTFDPYLTVTAFFLCVIIITIIMRVK